MEWNVDDARLEAAVARNWKSPYWDFELVAARVMSQGLNVRTVLQDDGSARGMPDLRFEWPDGRTEFGEVVLDADPSYAGMVASLKDRGNGGIPMPLLFETGRVWFVTVDSSSNIGRLREHLPHVLSAFESLGIAIEMAVPLGRMTGVPDAFVRSLESLGVTGINARFLQGTDEAGALVYPEGVSGAAVPNWQALSDWLTSLLAAPRLADVRRKLGATSAGRGHVFVGATFSTPGDAYFALTRPGRSLPSTDLLLPPEVVSVWAMPSQGATDGGLAYIRRLGWRDLRSS